MACKPLTHSELMGLYDQECWCKAPVKLLGVELVPMPVGLLTTAWYHCPECDRAIHLMRPKELHSFDYSLKPRSAD
jgi:hypothetical protein